MIYNLYMEKGITKTFDYSNKGLSDDGRKELDALIDKVKTYDKRSDTGVIERAFKFASKYHSNQFRKSGEPFVHHPIAVASLLADLKLDITTLAAALLHDVVEDTDVDIETVREEFGDQVAQLIGGLTKLDLIKFSSEQHEQAENIRKMFLAMAKDLRVILIKLADRLHNMQTISHLSKYQQKEKARETLDIYAPLAHRLGISQFKWRLEDLSFQALEPRKYEEIKRMIAERREEREEYLNSAIYDLDMALKKDKIKARISGRPKHLYSIYQKMVTRKKEFEEIYDLSAVRVIANSVNDCYATLGSIHTLWKPMPGRFKDYIAMPKFNMYQSLHTTVIGPSGKPLEIQVRTDEMHSVAEFGIAAHWRYKSSNGEPNSDLPWLKAIVEWQKDLKDPVDFMENLKIDLFDDEVFVFTPKGRVLSLPRGATPIDFAYSIHTDIGNTCIGALINSKIVPLGYELRNGDIIEILTSKNAHPSKDWLQIATTTKAKSKIRQWFSKHQKEDSLQLGKEVLQKAMRKKRLAATISQVGGFLEQIAGDYNFKTADDLVASIGSAVTSVSQVVSKLSNLIEAEKTKTAEEKDLSAHQLELKPKAKTIKKPFSEIGVNVHGVNDVMVRLSRCCNPMPGDEIMGFITRGRGISVHSRECRNVPALLRDPERKVDVSWESQISSSFVIEIEVHALDRKMLLRDITSSISDAQININSAKVSIGKDKTAVFRFSFEVSSIAHLSSILKNVRRINSVIDAYRVSSGKKDDSK